MLAVKNVFRISNKNPAEVDVAHALGKVTGVRNLDQEHRVMWMLEKYVEDNYYGRFDTHSYHRHREIHFNARLDVES